MNISSKRPMATAVAKAPEELREKSAVDKKAPSANRATLAPKDYLEHKQVQSLMQELKTEFGENLDGVGGKRALIISDVIDGKKHQYVNLVQKGGGVLGIALVGYTHILELAGIRFARMAGTSAGAINTALFAAVGDDENPKAQAKSDKLIGYLSELDMFSFVDGHPFAKWLIRNFISDTNFLARVKKVLIGLATFLLLLVVASVLLVGLQKGLEKEWGWKYASAITRSAFVLTGLAFVLTMGVGAFLGRMLTRLRDSAYGINPGNNFLKWIKDRLDENGVDTIDKLKKKAEKLPPDLQMRDPSKPLGKLDSDVTFITSELVTQNKIEFPKMWRLFRAPADIDNLHPGEFVRASMSIPFFFESHIISDIPVNDPDVKKAWKEYFECNADHIPNTVRFVDGGVLSNFPINIFYNPRVAEARLPSFGIDLDDTPPTPERGDGAAAWSLASYCGRMLNTIRYYYDKDFLLKNNVFARGVGKVKLYDPKFNWLDFFLSDQTKLDLFLQGAIAAKEFLMDFNWEEYKDARREMHYQLQNEHAPTPAPIAHIDSDLLTSAKQA